MRFTSVALVGLLVIAAGGLVSPEVPAASLAASKTASERSIYLVEFDEPPLATYRGGDLGRGAKFARLKATSPAVTGERKLNVASADSLAYRDALSELREDRLLAAGARFGRVLEPLFVYEVATNGMAIELSAAEAEALGKMEGVRSVQPDRVLQMQTDAGPQWINADQVWGGPGTATRGEGVVVGIVDSGINRTHPSFAGVSALDGYNHVNPRARFYGRCTDPVNAEQCNSKLIGIYDFTACTGGDTGCDDREANDGLDPDGHGTHVAGTAVGNPVNMSLTLPTGSVTRTISGVAPRANVIAYKACEEEENCRYSWVVAAINQAVADGVDVFNYSIGGSAFSPWVLEDSVAMLSAREAGVLVVVSAGNGGPGVGTISSPGDSPWVIAAANATHDRGIVNRLVDLAGGATAPPSGGILLGAGSTGGYGPRAIVRDPLFPGCAQGNDLDSPPSGASNPWPAGRFNGEIVVCDRGIQARVAKSNNVRLAGGGGMVLVNTEAEGESVVADSHSIPSTHIGFIGGSALKAWLATGTGHQGRIEGAQLRNEDELGDVLSASSSRGPSATAVGVLKPDITAPGSTILAAAGTGTGGIFRSGTSMAAPHVTGAAALLIAAEPTWTVSQVESALLTTASNSVRQQDAVTPATPFDGGAGTVDAFKALSAGLSFNITPAEYRAANPATGGQPRNLNRPSIVHDDCFERCSITRRVTDMVGGASWRVEADLPSPASATITPSTFTLTSGQSQNITITFDVSDATFPGSWVNGRLRFVRTAGAAAANAEIPLAVFADPGALPARIEIATGAESGFKDVTMSQLVALPSADFRASSLVSPVVTARNIGQDQTPTNRYDSFTTGLFYTTVTVPAASGPQRSYALIAETQSATAPDVDLFVGEDLDGDGLPEQNEQLCTSLSDFARERCELRVTSDTVPRSFWVLVQSFTAGPTAVDSVVLETILAPVDDLDSEALTVTGPGRTNSRQAFPVRISWDDPTMLPGDRRVGVINLGAKRSLPGQVGQILVDIKRSAAPENAAAVLDPNGTRRMRLAPGTSQDRLFLDVPANASSLNVSTQGTGEVDLYLSRVDAPAASSTIAPAPARALAVVSSVQPGAVEVIRLADEALPPGRWYVTPVNPGTTAAEFDLTVVLAYDAPRPTPRFGVYYNPARSGSGLHIYPGSNGAVWGVSWYTYLEDGTPTWYLGVVPPPTAQQGVWRVPMFRYAWDGSAITGAHVANAQLSFTSADRMTFSFELDGQAGSEPLVFIDGGACAQLNGTPSPISGVWYSPARSGTGHTINAHPNIENNGTYIYDALGIARWVLAQATPFGAATLPINQLDGFCPLCAHKTPTLTPIGSLTRSYSSATNGNMKIDLQFQPPMSGTWNIDLPMQKLSDSLPCQ